MCIQISKQICMQIWSKILRYSNFPVLHTNINCLHGRSTISWGMWDRPKRRKRSCFWLSCLTWEAVWCSATLPIPLACRWWRRPRNLPLRAGLVPWVRCSSSSWADRWSDQPRTSGSPGAPPGNNEQNLRSKLYWKAIELDKSVCLMSDASGPTSKSGKLQSSVDFQQKSRIRYMSCNPNMFLKKVWHVS